MKTHLTKFSFIAISFLLLNCSTSFEESIEATSDDIVYTESDANTYPLDLFLTTDYKISYNEVYEEAANFITFWKEETETRHRIKELKPLVIDERSILNSYLSDYVTVLDTVAYIANFEDDKGFLLLSADSRLQEPILAVVESGNFNEEISDPGMDLFLSNFESYILEKIVDFEEQKPKLITAKLKEIATTLPVEEQEYLSTIELSNFINIFFNRYITISTRTSYWYVEDKVKPLSPIEWGQGDTYNSYTKSKGCNGNAPYTGCVATATAQLMTHWKYPTTIDNHTYGWNQMQNYTDQYSFDYRNGLYKNWTNYVSSSMPFSVKDDIARLMERIGANVGMSYKCNESGAKTSNAVKYLNKLGYTGGSYFPYNFNVTVSSLNQGSIVLAEGWSTKRTHRFLGIRVQTTYHDGHAWLIDGYLKLRQDKQTIINVYQKGTNRLLSTTTKNETYRKDYIHNNWGWGGVRNGYFFSNSFNSNVIDLPSDASSFTVGGSQDYNYQFQNGIYPFIKKP